MYSSSIRHHLMNPTNGRRGTHYNGVGEVKHEVKCRSNPDRVVKNRVKFSICVDNGTILDARREIFGDPVAVAAGSWCVQKIVGKTIDEMPHLVIPEQMALDLEIKNELDIRAGCSAVIESLVSAFNDYRNRKEEQGS